MRQQRLNFFFTNCVDRVGKRGLHILGLLLIVNCSLFIVNCANPLVNAVLGPKTISFESNGGSRIKSQTVYRDYPVKRPANPSKSGYTFDAWYSDNETFLEKWDFSAIPSGDMTLYAQWNIAGADETSISSVSISVPRPENDGIPGSDARGTGNFAIGVVSWSPGDNPFKSGVVYTVSVALAANEGYSFAEQVAARINGQTALVTSNTGNALTLSYTFAATDTRIVTSIAVTAQPAKLIYTHGDTLDLAGLEVTLTYNDSAAEYLTFNDFLSRSIVADPAHSAVLSHMANNGFPVTITYDNMMAGTSNLTVSKAAGAAVAAPSASDATIGVNSITLAAVAAPANGQTVEYGINTINAEPSAWQPERSFGNLTAGTIYYFFARSAASDNYEAGASSGTAITTAIESSNIFDVKNAAEWNNAVSAINNRGAGEYNINVINSFSMDGVTGNTFTATDIDVIISGNHIVTLTETGSLLRIGDKQSVTLQDLTLQGYTNNNTSLVYIAAGGTFTMSSGNLTGNSAAYGGGVYVSGGTFTMSGGAVSGNTATTNGGGVYVSDGTFTMNSGDITENGATYSGGGVFVGSDGTFKMISGAMTNNTANSGGGVYSNGTSTMSDGEISGNHAITHVSTNTSGSGGGVNVSGGTFTLSDSGKINGNTADQAGGVYVIYSTFNMTGGTISGNSVTGNGGGLLVADSGEFKISSGTVYGTNESISSLRNTAEKGGAALCLRDSGTAQYSNGASWNNIDTPVTDDYGGKLREDTINVSN